MVDERGEFGEGEVCVALSVVLHGETVAGEGVGGVELQDFVEGGDLVHELMVRCGGWGWQVCKLLDGCERGETHVRKSDFGHLPLVVDNHASWWRFRLEV